MNSLAYISGYMLEVVHRINSLKVECIFVCILVDITKLRTGMVFHHFRVLPPPPPLPPICVNAGVASFAQGAFQPLEWTPNSWSPHIFLESCSVSQRELGAGGGREQHISSEGLRKDTGAGRRLWVQRPGGEVAAAAQRGHRGAERGDHRMPPGLALEEELVWWWGDRLHTRSSRFWSVTSVEGWEVSPASFLFRTPSSLRDGTDGCSAHTCQPLVTEYHRAA